MLNNKVLFLTGGTGSFGNEFVKVVLKKYKKIKKLIIFSRDELKQYEMKKIFPSASIEKDIIGEIVGFDREDKSDACELISSLTGDNSRQVVSFGTEAGLFQEIGISTVVCGPGSIEQAHKIDEFIVLDELKKCLNLLDGINKKSIPN